MLAELYIGLDQTLLKGAGAAVRAWNWTTGRTRSDLASLLWGGGTYGLAVDEGKPEFFVVSALATALYHHVFKRVEREEDREDDVLSPQAEEWRQVFGFVGPTMGGLGGVSLAEGEHFAAGSCGLASAAFYVMRTEPVKPRKDCVRRGLEYLAETLAPTPVPVPVASSYNHA